MTSKTSLSFQIGFCGLFISLCILTDEEQLQYRSLFYDLIRTLMFECRKTRSGRVINGGISTTYMSSIYTGSSGAGLEICESSTVGNSTSGIALKQIEKHRFWFEHAPPCQTLADRKQIGITTGWKQVEQTDFHRIYRESSASPYLHRLSCYICANIHIILAMTTLLEYQKRILLRKGANPSSFNSTTPNFPCKILYITYGENRFPKAPRCAPREK